MKLKCEKCDREATVHLTEVHGGEKIERHLCEQCAAEEGLTVKAQIPIPQLLEEMLGQASGKRHANLRCDVCGISFAEFRDSGLLGCPNDYEAFEDVLADLLERSHDGASHHVGKVPASAGESQRREGELLRLRGWLKEAVGREDYERAAEIRDRIRELETS
jgi:protein arginine kinase activator